MSTYTRPEENLFEPRKQSEQKIHMYIKKQTITGMIHP